MHETFPAIISLGNFSALFSSPLSCETAPFVVLWLERAGFWGVCLCLLAFWVASFFSCNSGIKEAKKKTQVCRHRVIPQVPRSPTSLPSLHLLEALYVCFYIQCPGFLAVCIYFSNLRVILETPVAAWCPDLSPADWAWGPGVRFILAWVRSHWLLKYTPGARALLPPDMWWKRRPSIQTAPATLACLRYPVSSPNGLLGSSMVLTL